MKVAQRIRQQLDATRQHHADNWRGWAAALARGEKGPTPADVMEVAAALQIVDPGRQLEHDAKVVAEVTRLEERAVRERAERAAALEPHGGEQGIHQLIQQKRAELAELERLASPWAAMAGVHRDQQAAKLRRCNPRMFGQWPVPQQDDQIIEVTHAG